MARAVQCFLGLVVLVAVIIVVTVIVTNDIGEITTATYRRFEFSAQVSYFTKKLQQVSNASDNKVTWELTDGLPTLDSEECTAEQMKHLTLLTHKHNFTFPCHQVFKPVGEIMKAQWVQEFIELLSQFESRDVTLVVANTRYEEILLNWLISATVIVKPPLKNILVIALDIQLYEKLKHREIPSIWVPYSSIFNGKHKLKPFDLVMMTRLGLMRLVNHFGYDCAMYDIDAIVLKNPQQLYSRCKSDIISSRGTFPRELRKQWHVAMCIGAVFIRSNYRTEQYWETVTKVHLRVENANDQVRLNYGLYVLGTNWTGRFGDAFKSPMYGLSKNNLTTTVLPFIVICRYDYCRSSMRSFYYIWHKGGNRNEDSKKAGAAQGHTWYLRKDWTNCSQDDWTLTGTQWLHTISNLH